MRRIFHLAGLCLVAGVGSACTSPDEVIETTEIPTAGVRFIHAVPDTGAMDMRFVDIVESNAHWNVAFRNSPVISPTGANGVPASSLVQFKNARAGQRHFTIFMSGTTVAIASTVVKDTTVTLVAGKNYTAILWGYANPTGPGRPGVAPVPGVAPAMRLTFFEEDAADPGTSVALRVINAHNVAIDASHYPAAAATPTPLTAIASGVAALAKSAYVMTTPAQVRYYALLAGTATRVLAAAAPNPIALIGAAAEIVAPGPKDALPGTTVAGSAISAIVFPPSVVGTGAPQGGGSASVPAWTSPAITFVFDRRPPRAAGT